MGFEKVFEIQKSPTEKRLHNVRFESEYPDTPYVIQSTSVKVYDSNGDDVTEDIVESESHSGDTLQFMVMQGARRGRYKVIAKAYMSNGEDPEAPGELIVDEF